VSIAPPSDIVLDVAQAADPARVQAAAAKLASMAGAPAADIDFAAVLQARSRPIASPPAPTPASLPNVAYGRGHQLDARPGSPYQKFEAVVLQNFIQTILPKNSDLFGDAFSADAYRSMLAEQIATQVAKSGRLGVAHAIETREAATHPRPEDRNHGGVAAAPVADPKPSSS
jgi:peptidoglycan hydrolase FlgJ